MSIYVTASRSVVGISLIRASLFDCNRQRHAMQKKKKYRCKTPPENSNKETSKLDIMPRLRHEPQVSALDPGSYVLDLFVSWLLLKVLAFSSTQETTASQLPPEKSLP